MQGVLEQMLLFIVKQLLTDKVVYEAKVQLVAYLKTLSADTTNKIDDFMVQIIADALGVPVP